MTQGRTGYRRATPTSQPEAAAGREILRRPLIDRTTARRVAVLPVRDTFVKKLLKCPVRGADTPDVLVERLIVEGDGEAASVDFHPRLTVLGGMPGDARGALGSLLSGALHGTVRGVHLEVVDDSGRRLVTGSRAVAS